MSNAPSAEAVEAASPLAGPAAGFPRRLLRQFRLRHQLMAIIIFTSSTALLVAMAAMVAADQAQWRRNVQDQLEAVALLVDEATTDPDRTKKQQALATFVQRRSRMGSVAQQVAPRILAAAVYYRGKTGPLVVSHPEGLELPAATENELLRPTETLIGEDYVERRVPVPRRVALYGAESNLAVLLRFSVPNRRWIYVGGPLAVWLISLGIAWLISSRLERLISQPVTQLAETTDEVSNTKDYTLRLETRRADEIGDLIRGFNDMLCQIQQRDQALLKAQGQLEQRVHERTQALEQEIVERRRAEKDLAQQLARISLLNQITHAISDRQDLPSILNIVLGQLVEHLPVDFGCVLLHDTTFSRLRLAASCVGQRPLAAPLGDWSVPVQPSGWPVPQTDTVCVQRDADRSENPLFERPTQLGLRAVVALPMRVEGQLFGVMIVARQAVDSFDAGECHFLQNLSEHVALAGHQARLHMDLQKAYNDLRESQKVAMQQERLSALGQMASGVAHDINNALSPVSGFAELLLAAEAGLSESGRRQLQLIKTAADDIAHIVTRLREFYRPRQGEQDFVAVDLSRLIGEVIELTRPRWRDVPQRRGISIELRTDLCPGAPTVRAVEAELREVLTNLIFNAVDALPEGGTITLRSRSVTRGALPAGTSGPTHLALEVIDTGVGMSEKAAKRCFEPFFTTKQEKGTGLGLAMVYGTMQRHEGTIEVESVLGRGTTMRLLFPMREVTAPAFTPPIDLGPLPSLRVLFVDDEPLLRELLREILEADGHTVVTADGGPAGLELFRQMTREGQPPDVVITDLGMPHLDGRELTQIIKRESPSTPVIMITGWGSMLRKEEELRAPVDALLSKPPRMVELQDALRRVYKGRGAPAA